MYIHNVGLFYIYVDMTQYEDTDYVDTVHMYVNKYIYT